LSISCEKGSAVHDNRPGRSQLKSAHKAASTMLKHAFTRSRSSLYAPGRGGGRGGGEGQPAGNRRRDNAANIELMGSKLESKLHTVSGRRPSFVSRFLGFVMLLRQPMAPAVFRINYMQNSTSGGARLVSGRVGEEKIDNPPALTC